MDLSRRNDPSAAALQLELDLGDGRTVPIALERGEDGRVKATTTLQRSIVPISTEEAAEELFICSETVRKHIKAGRIRGGRFGRNIKADRIHVLELREAILEGKEPLSA